MRQPPTNHRLMFGVWRFRAIVVAGCFAWLCGAATAFSVSRKALFGFAAASAATLCFWIGAEVLDRMLGLQLFRDRPHPLGTEAVAGIELDGFTYQDTFRNWGVHSDPIRYAYATDGRGFRHTKHHDKPDIIFLGDSVVVAALLPFAETVTGRIDGAGDQTVSNVALVGIGPQEENLLLRRTMPQLAGITVVHFIFEGNDLLDSAAFRRPKDSSLPSERHGLTYRVWMTLQRLSDPVHPDFVRMSGKIAGQTYTFFWGRRSHEGVRREIPHVLESLQATREHVDQSGGRYALVFVPSKLRVLGPLAQWPHESVLHDWPRHLGPFRGALADWATQGRITFVDMTEPLRTSAMRGKIPYFPGDTHLNADGHSVMATTLARQLALNTTWSDELPATSSSSPGL